MTTEKTTEMTTEQLVSQLVLAAQWDAGLHAAAPVRAAAQLLGIDPMDPRLDGITDEVHRVEGLTWPEMVGYAAHLLLAPSAARLPVAA